MKNAIALGAMLVCISVVHASELTFEFKSPAFSGIGYSSHILTIEQLETNRKRQNRDDAQAELDRLDREHKSTNAYKFQNNLESRIYAQLSRQIADSMFNIQTWSELTSYNSGDIVTKNGKQWISVSSDNTTTPGENEENWKLYNPEWIVSQTPFGDTVRWKREDGLIYVEVKDSNGDELANFSVPVGSFAF
jgi:hypothetical protein